MLHLRLDVHINCNIESTRYIVIEGDQLDNPYSRHSKGYSIL
jgi:hypothetical protein